MKPAKPGANGYKSRNCGQVHIGIVARRMKQDFDHGETARDTL